MKTIATSFLRRLRRTPTYAAIWMRRLGKWLRTDPATKLGSLALAVLLFLFLHGLSPKIDTRVIRVPVEPDLLKESSKTISDISATEVKMELRGRVDLLQSIKPEELRLRVGRDLRNRSSTISIRLTRNHLERTDGAFRAIPDDVRILSFEPNTIQLTLEEQCSRDFLIAMPEILGTPILGTVNTNAIDILGKREITVTGPSNIVAHLYDNSVRLATAPIDVSNSSQTFEETVDLIPPTAIRPYIDEQDMKVRVRIPIDDETATAVFSNILVNVAAVADGERIFSCSPTNVIVTVSGNKTNIAAMNATNIAALVSGNEAAAAEGGTAVELPVRVFFRTPSLYATLRLHDPEPLTVSVRAEVVDRSLPSPADPAPDVLFVTPQEPSAAPEPEVESQAALPAAEATAP